MSLSMTTVFDSFKIISFVKLSLSWTTVFDKDQLPLSMTMTFGPNFILLIATIMDSGITHYFNN